VRNLTFLLLLFSCAAFAAKITYHKGKVDFVVEYDGKTFSYMSPALKHVFIIDDCNRSMVEGLWKKLSRNALKFPRATSLPDEKRGYVQIGNEYRLILPLVKDRLAFTEKELLALRSQEKQKCKR
jgi:hypothetical protein